MMNRSPLFNLEGRRYVGASAADFENEISAAIKPVIDAWVEKGYDRCHMELAAQHAVFDSFLMLHLGDH